MTLPEIPWVRECDRLPSLPPQIARVLEQAALASAMDYNVVRIIQYDPAIAARVLKLANAPLYGYSGQISSLQQAAGLLGPGVIKSIILTTPILEVWEGPGAPYKQKIDYGRLWRHASATGAIAGGLGSLWNGFETDVCFTCGLLHDLGKLALAVMEPRGFFEAFDGACHGGADPLTRERERLGFTHWDLGRELARAWSYPDSLVAALGGTAEAPDPSEEPIHHLVVLAGYLADEWGFDDGTGWSEPRDLDACLQAIGRSWQDLRQGEPELKKYAALVSSEEPGRAGRRNPG